MSRLPLPVGDSAPLGSPTGRDYNFRSLSLGEEVASPLVKRVQCLNHSETDDPARDEAHPSMQHILARHEVPQPGATVAVQSTSSSPSSSNTSSSLVVPQNGLRNLSTHSRNTSSLVQTAQRLPSATDLGRTASSPAVSCLSVSGLTVYDAAPPPGALTNLAMVRPLSEQGPKQGGSEVILHVYDLDKRTKRLPGMMAFYHIGIEVFKQEIFFSVQGILSCKPGGHQTHIHKKTVDLGHTAFDDHQVKAILEQMGQEWKGNCYSLTGRNCQTFAVAFAEKLGLGTNCIPAELHWKWDIHSNSSSVGGAALGLLGRMLQSKSGSGSRANSMPA